MAFEKRNSITHCSLQKCSISATAELFHTKGFKKLAADNEWRVSYYRLALMNVHGDIEVCVDQVIDRFAVRIKQKTRLCHLVCK